MTKFNKSLLAAAVVGALALPGLASAATLTYPAGQQITFAKDLIVNDGTTIYTPNSLRLAAQAADSARLATIGIGENVTVKVTLTAGAKFDTTADVNTLVGSFEEGVQTGGAPGPLTLVGNPYYSASGQELNFTYTATANGAIPAAPAAPGYFLELNSMQIANLVQGLAVGSSVGAEITVQNSDGQQVLASSAVIARSVWGLAVEGDPTLGDTATTIDVGSDPRKTLFSSTGDVGLADAEVFNAGAVIVDIAQAGLIGGGADYVNNFNAVAATPEYNVVATADIVVNVTGADLTAFSGGNVWLDNTNTCDKATNNFIAGTVAGNAVTFKSAASHALWSSVTNAPPGPSTAFVCFAANNDKELIPQELTGTVSVDYKLSTQRVNPPAQGFDLLPLRLNGTTVIFQNVNPAGNATAQSFLRLTNNNATSCPVTIDAKDDAGKHSGSVQLTLDAHGSKQLNSEVLEGAATAAGVTGGFGDGTGKWYVRVTAECANFKASALNRHQDGVVTDLTPEKGDGNEWLTPSAKL